MSRRQPALEERDLGLRRARRVTVITAAVAATLAGATAGVAAMTLPGRSTGGSPSTAPAPAGQDGSAAQGEEDGLRVPDQAPRAAADQGPLVISGGS
jgi:hypothetical protein